MALGGLLCSTLLDPRHFPPESSSHFSVTPALMRLSPWRLPPPGDSGLVPCVALLIPASCWPQRPSWARHTKRVWQEGRKGRGWPWGRGREGHAAESPEFSHEPSGPTACRARSGSPAQRWSCRAPCSRPKRTEPAAAGLQARVSFTRRSRPTSSCSCATIPNAALQQRPPWC